MNGAATRKPDHPHAKCGARLYRQEEHLALMHAIGTKGYDPMPPSQHAFYMDRDQPLANRVVAVVENHTIRRRQKDGNRSAVALREDDNFLEVADVAEILDVTTSNCWVAVREAEADRRIRVDAGGHLWLTGEARAPRMSREEKAKERDGEFVQKAIHPSIYLFLKELAPEVRDRVTPRLLGNADRHKQHRADLIAASREDELKDAIAIAAEEGYQHQEPSTGRPRATQKRPLTVKITYVQIPNESFAHKSEATSVHSEIGFVQPPHPYRAENLKSREPQRVSDGEGEGSLSAEEEKEAATPQPQPSTPPPAPTQNQNLPKEMVDASPVVAKAEWLFGHPLDPVMRTGYANLPRVTGLPWRSVNRWLDDKWHEKRDGQDVDNPGALLQWAEPDLPKWAIRNWKKIQQDRKWEESDGRAAEELAKGVGV